MSLPMPPDMIARYRTRDLTVLAAALAAPVAPVAGRGATARREAERCLRPGRRN